MRSVFLAYYAGLLRRMADAFGHYSRFLLKKIVVEKY